MLVTVLVVLAAVLGVGYWQRARVLPFLIKARDSVKSLFNKKSDPPSSPPTSK